MATSSPIPFRARHRAWMARRSRVGRLTLRLLFVLLAAILLRSIGFLDVLDDILIVVSGTVLLPLLIILFYRWVTQRVLWKVRNRLILTYLLMGLSPVVLFGTLGGIAAYLLAGQYATSSALSVIDQESMKLKDETASEAAFALGQSPCGTVCAAPLHGIRRVTRGDFGTAGQHLASADNARFLCHPSGASAQQSRLAAAQLPRRRLGCQQPLPLLGSYHPRQPDTP